MRRNPAAWALRALTLYSPHSALLGACSELRGNAALLSASEQSQRASGWATDGGRLVRRRISGRSSTSRPGEGVTAKPDHGDHRRVAAGSGVTAEPEVQVFDGAEEYAGPRWNLESSEGGSDKSLRWRKKKGGGTGTWMGSIFFVTMIGMMPAVLAAGAHKLTMTQVLESLVLYMWLLGGLYLFTHVLIFQSPHFENPRTLSVEEAAYLTAQILTTVGYGDITPARPRGQLFVGLFVLTAVLLVASMVQEMLEFFENLVEKTIERVSEEELEESEHHSEKRVLRKAFEPVIYTSLVFCGFVAFGTMFFVLYPGEGKTLAQGVYMSLITLSTVGFGAFTPSTHAGMVVSAFWMLFGTTSLVGVVTSRAAFSLALKRHELRQMAI